MLTELFSPFFPRRSKIGGRCIQALSNKGCRLRMKPYSFPSKADVNFTLPEPSAGLTPQPAVLPPPHSGLSIPSPGCSSTLSRVLPTGRPESPERGAGATLLGSGTGMLSRLAGLVSLGSRSRPPPPPAPHGALEERTFYPSHQPSLFLVIDPSVRPPTVWVR